MTIVVAGSANLDIVVTVPHHPVRGETVLGGDHVRVPGGKGANQAVAAARLGGTVAFVGRVGNDGAGAELRGSLDDAGVNTIDLQETAAVPSGIAMISVGPDGDNAIIVSPGANHHLSPRDIEQASALVDADVLLLQLEVPIETNLAAAHRCSGMVIVDPAPAPADGLPAELLAAADLIIPNESELSILAGRAVDPHDPDDVVDAAQGLATSAVIVTLGDQGAMVVGDSVEHVRAPVITPVDTTAAGDAFRAAIGVAIDNGVDLVEATRWAVRVGAATALRFGAQPSLPTRSEVEDRLS